MYKCSASSALSTVFKIVLFGQERWGSDWFICVCVCMRVRELVCVHACIHFISVGFPVQYAPIDTTDDGCTAVICLIRPGFSIASSTTEQPRE